MSISVLQSVENYCTGCPQINMEIKTVAQGFNSSTLKPNENCSYMLALDLAGMKWFKYDYVAFKISL